MQKVILALIFTLGLTAAQWTQNLTVVANSSTDPNLVNNPQLISSGDNLLIETVVVNSEKTNATVYSKSVATKNLQSSKNTSWVVSFPNTTVAKGTPQSVLYRDTTVEVYTKLDNNNITQVYIDTQNLASSGSSVNTRAITTLSTDAALPLLSINVHTHSNRVYVTAQQGGQIVLLGTDVSGSSNTNVTLANGTVTAGQIGCAGVAGSNELYCAWLSGSNLLEARVDPSKGVVGNVSSNDTALANLGALYAWSTSVTQGVVLSEAGNVRVRSRNSNSTTDLKLTAAQVLRVLPANDNVAIFWNTVTGGDLNVQFVNVNATAVNNTVLAGANPVTSNNIVQHKNGAVYVLVSANNEVKVGEVWGNTQLGASALETIVYACFALLAALFVF